MGGSTRRYNRLLGAVRVHPSSFWQGTYQSKCQEYCIPVTDGKVMQQDEEE